MNHIRLIGFDLDDTLFNATNLADEARLGGLEKIRQYGLDFKLSKGFELLHVIVKEYGSNYPYHYNVFLERLKENPQLFGLSKTEFSIPKYVAAGVIGYHEVKVNKIKPFPEVSQVLSNLKEQSFILVVISDGLAVKQYEKLMRLGILHYFDKIYISEEVGWEKPNPKFYQHCLDQHNIDGSKAIYIGDRMDYDISPAKEVGMQTVLIHRGGKHDTKLLNQEKTPHFITPDHEINDLTQLTRILESYR